MKNKKGQITLFIIIAIVIIAVVILFAVFWPRISSLFMSQQDSQQYLASQATKIQEAITECVEKESLDAFKLMGLQAGYYDTTGLDYLYYVDNHFYIVSFKNSAGQKVNRLPSLAQVQEQYQKFLELEGNAAIDKCLNNLNSFRKNVDIETGNRKIIASIQSDSIMINVDWPMKLSKTTARGKVEQNINQKPIMLLIPFGSIWEVANLIVDCEVRENCKYEGIEWDKDIWDNPFRFQYVSKEARSLNKNQIAFILTSIPYRINEEPYLFYFGIDRT